MTLRRSQHKASRERLCFLFISLTLEIHRDVRDRAIRFKLLFFFLLSKHKNLDTSGCQGSCLLTDECALKTMTLSFFDCGCAADKNAVTVNVYGIHGNNAGAGKAPDPFS